MWMPTKKGDAILLSKASYHTFGWLRRPEYDTHQGSAYELPNGDILYAPDPCHKWGLTLEIWLDTISGEKFCTLPKRNVNAVPRA